MSLAAATRDAVDAQPVVYAALEAAIANYTAVARYLDVDGDTEAVATALRRYASELEASASDAPDRTVRVQMQSGLEPGVDPAEALLVVGETALGTGEGRGTHTAIIVTGDVDGSTLAVALAALFIQDIEPVAAAGTGDVVSLVVDRLEGANAVRAVERSLETV